METLPLPSLEGSEADSVFLRNQLLNSDFTQAAICRRLHLTRLAMIDAETVRARDSGPLGCASDVLIRLFLEGWPVRREEVERLLPPDVPAVLERLNLMVKHGADMYAATVTLYPIEDLYIASDRYNNADGSPFEGADDMVDQCLFPTTERLITGVPRTACDSVLDMCAGCGVGGLLCAATAKRVLAVDVTARSVHFVRFNAMLNGFTNVEARRGNLYEPVEGETFDRITAHPPYQPVWRHLQTFNSGGFDGEQIAKAVLEDAPRHLKPGGRLYCLCQLSDREHAAEARVRSWLTPEARTCVDIAFVCFQHRNVIEYSAISALCENWPAAEWKEWVARLRPLHIRGMVYGMFVLQHAASARKTFTVRREGPCAHAAEIEALVNWETEAAHPLFADRVDRMHLRLRPECELLVRHKVDRVAWQPSGATLRNTKPFEASLQIDSLTMGLLARLDGCKPLGEHLRAVSLKAPAEKVAALVCMLVSQGFAEVIR
ncbi:MAG: methyltransferase [Bryobacterales bacterium]|nr:methyltransferase [Bryobacterales bacterium]